MAFLLKYYTFSAKIRTLTDFHTRISCNQQPPSNAEIITTLRYFQQTLIGFLKDVPSNNSTLFEKFVADSQRTSQYPNLNYSGLFYGIVNLLDVFPIITSGQTAIAEAILDTLKALYFFLDRECVDQLPYLLASQLGTFPAELDKKIVQLLCDCILPYSTSDDAFGGLSVPVVLMLVLQHPSDPGLHSWLLESLMSRRENVYHDLLSVIAKGTSEARISAVNLLFHYWPLINPQILHRKPIQYRVHGWSPVPCQNTMCTEKGPSIKRSYDPVACAKYGDTSPPMSICKGCFDQIETDQPLYFICQPMPASHSVVCQNKGCEASNRIAVGTCFAEDCIRAHQHVPLRLCQECFTHLHANPGAEAHRRHSGMACVWNTILERDMIEAVVKLLKETSASLEGIEGEGKRPKWLRQLEGGQSLGRDIDSMSDERRMLSRYGIWLMAALCPPAPEAPSHAIGYIMSMLFQWFSTTALLPNDSMGAALEQLKTDFASDWMNLAISNHYEVFVTILMPDLPEYAQVGGAWDKFSSKKDQMKDGLSKMLALMPYDVISFETWNRVIPKWLRAISDDIEDEDLPELKILLCKIFEPDLCPLPFETNKVYEFISSRLLKGNYEETLDALDWLHLLCRMDITMSLNMVFDMFIECLKRLPDLNFPIKNEENDLEEDPGPLAVQVVMVDIISQQMRLNEISPHEVATITDLLFSTASLLLQYPIRQIGDEHTCQNPETDQFSDCVRCQQSVFLYQILMQLTEQLCPKDEMRIEVDQTDPNDWLNDLQLTDSGTTPSHISNLGSPWNPSIQATPSPKLDQAKEQKPPGSFQFLTANVQQESSPADEFVGILPSEDFEAVTAQAITLTETDVGRETCQVVTQTLIESLKGTPLTPLFPRNSQRVEFWDTSVGRFRFTLEQLPAQLRFIYSLLRNIDREIDPDVQYFLMSILKYLCLHCEALSNARREHRGFLIWAQENLLIPRLWVLLRSDYAQVGQLVVPLIIHTITLPCGEEVFWNTVNRDFTSDKWETRFKAVERVYVLAHLIVAPPVKANKLLQTCLSCAFSHLVVSVHDPNAAVAQRALLAIQAMPTTSLNLMVLCLESQFDSCILDRPLIVNRIHLLTTLVPDDVILSWDFFIQRFETLALEAQLKSQSSEHGFVQDLLHSDPMSDLYQRKVTKARQSLNEAESVRSIVKSLRENSLKHQLTTNSRIERAGKKEEETDRADTSSILSPSLSGSTTGYNRLREFTDEESNLCLLLNRVVDLENPERHTIYLTVALFVHFLCNKKSTPTDEKANAKKQSVLLRHFNTLLGYSNSEKCFSVPPRRLRRAAVCNAFLTGLPEILDNNLLIGNQMLPTIVQLLLHLPSPQKFASDQPTADYSLSLMELPSRHSWLNTLILILYKYRYDTPAISESIKKLILIVISTIECHCHKCAKNGAETKPLEFTLWSDSSDNESATEEKTILEEDYDDMTPDSVTENTLTTTITESTKSHLIRPESLKVTRISSGGQLVTVAPEQPTIVHIQPTIVEPVIGIETPTDRPSTDSLSAPTTSKAGLLSTRRKRKNRKKRKQIRAECVRLICGFCNERLETFDEETISLCLISLSTFLHREPAMAAPLLLRIINAVTRFIDTPQFPWHDSNVFVAGNSRSAAKQLIRVILHQLSGSGIALQLFDSKIENLSSFWTTIASSLTDFNELNPVALIQCLLDDISENWPQRLARILHNLAAYIVSVPTDSCMTSWGSVIGLLDSFFRRYHSQVQHEVIHNPNRTLIVTELKSSVIIMTTVMHVHTFASFKSSVSLVEGFAKWFAEALHECRSDLRDLLAICTACNRAMNRERDKQCITRAIVNELIQAIKFKCELVEHNYMAIVELILQDYGEEISEDIADLDQFNTGASEAIRPFISDTIEFITDLHVLSKLKKQINSDRMGGNLKAGLSEIVALETSRPTVRDPRPVMKYIPWLLSPPNVTQTVPGAFAESVSNVRILSWLLLGALHTKQCCLPVPIDCSVHLADYIHYVFAGFAEQSKQSVVHMSALFHAFHLCQLWTVYCEQASISNEMIGNSAIDQALDFWARVTPAILQLFSHSKVLADMVNSHFITMVQALQRCNSAVLCQLYPMWQPIMTTTYHSQLSSQLRIRLEACENQTSIEAQPLNAWLSQLRFKIAQTELQTSAAAPFYNV
uniref:Uncoordinated protein 79 n=1 Tax=Acrobeloides nanus TaxID=290746 RepID=A0A914CGD5_9BILA